MSWLGDIRGRAVWVVVGCLLCQMGLGMGYVPAQLAEGMLPDLGWSRAEYGAAFAPQLVTQALASPVVGMLVVAVGIRPVLAVSVAVLAFTFAGVGFARETWHVWALAALMGAALAGVGDVTVGAGVARWVREARGRALGIVYGGANLGGGLFGMLAAWIMLRSDWRTAIIVVSLVAGALMLPAALWAVREPRPGELGEPEGEGTLEDTAPALDMRRALATRSFWILFLALFSIFFSFVALTRHLPVLLRDAGMSQEAAALFFGNAVMIGVLTKGASGFLADRIPARGAMVANHALYTLSFVVLLAVPAPGTLVLFFALYGFSANARDVVYPLLVAEAFGTRNLAPIYGALCLTLLPGGILGPIVAGWASDRFGSYAPALWIFLLLNALVLVLLPLVRRETEAVPAAPPVSAPALPRSRP